MNLQVPWITVLAFWWWQCIGILIVQDFVKKGGGGELGLKEHLHAASVLTSISLAFEPEMGKNDRQADVVMVLVVRGAGAEVDGDGA